MCDIVHITGVIRYRNYRIVLRICQCQSCFCRVTWSYHPNIKLRFNLTSFTIEFKDARNMLFNYEFRFDIMYVCNLNLKCCVIIMFLSIFAALTTCFSSSFSFLVLSFFFLFLVFFNSVIAYHFSSVFILATYCIVTSTFISAIHRIMKQTHFDSSSVFTRVVVACS